MEMPDLSIIVPAYQEADRIERGLKRVVQYAQQSHRKIELIVVDDGSRDATAQVARAIATNDSLSVCVLVNDRNRGKGYSVRRGMLAATGHVRLMSDADFSTPVEEIEKLLPWFEQGAEVVIGSRNMPDSKLEPPQPWYRRVMGLVFRTMRHMLVLGGIRDSQCGFKAFSAKAAKEVFGRLVETGFAFDVEALALANRLGHRTVEVGVFWRDDRRSSIRPVRDSLNMFLALWFIRRRLPGLVAAEPQKGEDLPE